MTPLEESYRECRDVARKAGSSFYWSFRLLPPDQQRAMHALYAFSRRADDLADQEGSTPGERRKALDDWKVSFDRALCGRYDDPLLRAVADTVSSFEIPSHYLHQLLQGVEMDLVKNRYQTFEELRQYCYRVASVVGLACIHIWGFDGPQALERGSTCGLAFQMTNILRDLKEDAQRGRIYLPLEEIEQFSYSPEQLLRGERTPAYHQLIQFQLQRADTLYDEAAETEQQLSAAGRRVFRMMFDTYRGLLEEIKLRDGDVFSQRIRLGHRRRLSIAVRHLLFARI